MNTVNTQKAIQLFREGKVGIFPTDTAFGIGCRMDDSAAVERVFEAKQRARDNALLVLVDSLKMAEKYVEVPDDVREKLIDTHWPGGLSIFFKTKPGMVLPIVTANTNVLAIRLPDHKGIEHIIHEVGVPIIATSANKSGGVTPYTMEEIDSEMLERVDFVLAGECTYKTESTIIDTTVTPWKTIREGAVKLS